MRRFFYFCDLLNFVFVSVILKLKCAWIKIIAFKLKLSRAFPMQFAVAVDNRYLVCWVNCVTVQKRVFKLKIEPIWAERPNCVCDIEFALKRRNKKKTNRNEKKTRTKSAIEISIWIKPNEMLKLIDRLNYVVVCFFRCLCFWSDGAFTLFFARLFSFHLFSVFFSLISLWVDVFVRFFPLFCPSVQEHRIIVCVYLF